MTDPVSSPSDNSDRSPQIQQNLEGNDNLAIGEMRGGIVIKHLTINDRIPTASLPPSNIVVQNLTQQEYRQRQVLLNKVKDAWVKGVLEKSLHARVSIELGLQERPDLVQQPFSDVAEFAAASGQALPEGTPATDVFDRLGSGRTLLIVGEPGSGKTIALLKLAADAIDRTEPDLRQQIPVVFNLSSWARKPQSIEQWLIQELLEKYQVSKALGKTWVESEALMLLLDGLDEVKAEQRNACVQALNQFMQTHGTTETVICCRIGDYQMLQDRLMLRSAICLQPLTATQIDLYFEQAGDRLSALKAVLPQDEELQELAKSPLMLSVMSLAYQDFTPEQLTVGGKIEDYRQRLFATYIDRMFQRRGTTQHYSREDTQRWLIWLAQRMTIAAQTMFLIERLQPSWLVNKKQRIQYLFKGYFACVLIYFLLNLLFCREGFNQDSMMYLLRIIPKIGSIKSIIFSIIFSIISGMFYSMYIPFMGDIKPIETLKWSYKNYKINLKKIDAFVRRGINRSSKLEHSEQNNPFALDQIVNNKEKNIVSTLSVSNYSRNHKNTSPIKSDVYWAVMLFSIPLFPILGGFHNSDIQFTEKPNQGISRSATNALTIGIFTFVVSSLIMTLVLWIGTGLSYESSFIAMLLGLNFGLISGFIFGGIACIQHFVLRFILYRNGYAPWNYARFLDYATKRLFLQKVGGGYIFIHRMLLEHFAEMSSEQEKR
jgi:NACHT domain